MPKELAHLDASRLKVKPMAIAMVIGRIPPGFLFNAKRRPPKKTGAASDGQWPARMVFTKAVRALRNSGPASRYISKSRMCWGSGPAAEPAIIILIIIIIIIIAAAAATTTTACYYCFLSAAISAAFPA